MPRRPPAVRAPGERAPSEPPLLVVAAAVLDDLAGPTRLLAARRRAPAALAGGWELPGGKVEPGEQPTAALVRELAEELAVDIELGAQLSGPDAHGGWPIDLPGRAGSLLVWTAVVSGGGIPTAGADHDALRWLTRTELTDVAWLPADHAPVALVGRLLHDPGVVGGTVAG
ncbi:MAG TPA: NUDIX domain-containing protein [Dermatophilaceae bacterium]|nr:NUDIX domain-containing protein [Dermatophilaceae bacterium]